LKPKIERFLEQKRIAVAGVSRIEAGADAVSDLPQTPGCGPGKIPSVDFGPKWMRWMMSVMGRMPD
jgi:hypothetical protein